MERGGERLRHTAREREREGGEKEEGDSIVLGFHSYRKHHSHGQEFIVDTMWEAFTTVALYCWMAAAGSSDRKNTSLQFCSVLIDKRKGSNTTKGTFPFFIIKGNNVLSRMCCVVENMNSAIKVRLRKKLRFKIVLSIQKSLLASEFHFCCGGDLFFMKI